MTLGNPTPYHSVRGLERGLAVLHALSEMGEGSSAQLAKATQLPRPTVHRLLETLRSAGYVTRPGLRDTYRLTLLIRSLADGYKDEDWISEICRPVLADLCDVVVWPTDIATYDNGAMVIRATTHQRSALSITRASAGLRVPMLCTATGKAYLAFCAESERTAILEILVSTPGPDRESLKLAKEVTAELLLTRRQGYGLRTKGQVPKISTIAVPLMAQEHVFACLNLNWITSAMDVATAISRYLPPLRDAAGQIEIEYSRYSATHNPPALRKQT